MQVHCQGFRLLKIEFEQTLQNYGYRKFKIFMHSGVKMDPRDSSMFIAHCTCLYDCWQF